MLDVEVNEGWLGQHETPDWEPLRALLPRLLCDGFMWMNSVELDNGVELQAYKHIDTRRYLWLDADALPYESLGDHGYRRMRATDAVEQVFGTLWVIHRATPAEKRALKSVFRAAGETDEACGLHLPPSSPALPLRFVP